MQSILSRKRDLYSGVLIFLIGTGATLLSLQYSIGTLADIGPGLFPAGIGALLALSGLAIAATATKTKDDREDHAIDWRGWSCIIGGTLAFAILGMYGGLVIRPLQSCSFPRWEIETIPFFKRRRSRSDGCRQHRGVWWALSAPDATLYAGLNHDPANLDRSLARLWRCPRTAQFDVGFLRRPRRQHGRRIAWSGCVVRDLHPAAADIRHACRSCADDVGGHLLWVHLRRRDRRHPAQSPDRRPMPVTCIQSAESDDKARQRGRGPRHHHDGVILCGVGRSW